MSSYSSPHTPNEAESDVEFSLYSLSSELDLDFACRGTAKPQTGEEYLSSKTTCGSRQPESLLVLTAKAIAQHFPFEVVESSPITVPEELQRLIAFHSFPTDEDAIWLYSCLSSGESYEFDQGEALWADKAVRECVQIGFHLSATVLSGLHLGPPLNPYQNGRLSDLLEGTLTAGNVTDPYHVNFSANPTSEARRVQAEPTGSAQPDGSDPNTHHTTDRGGLNIEPGYPAYRVSLTFDRGRITSCSCTCTFDVEERCANLTSPRYHVDCEGTRNAYSNNGVSFTMTGSANQNSVFGSFPYQAMSFTGPVRNGQPPRPGLVEPDTGNPQVASAQSINYLPAGLTPLRKFPGLFRYVLGKHTSPFGAAGLRWGMQPGASTSAHPASRHGRDLIPVTANGFAAIGATMPSGTWCSHVVATCLMRIRQPDQVLLRAPISESLSKLSKEDLQKFAQNLICYVGPKKILPAAQCILDQLLDSSDNPMKSSSGAPDPTAGGALGDAAAWCFDGAVLEEKLRVTLRRFWASKPALLYTDISSFNSHFPVSVDNFHCVLNSLRSNIPRGLWDLLSIIGDMMRRQDNNGVLLLEIVTRCILDMFELMSWWYVIQMDPCFVPKGVPLCQKHTHYAALWLCEEIVQLWRLACLNPELRPLTGPTLSGRFPSGSSAASVSSRDGLGLGANSWLLQQLASRLRAFHIFALEQAGFRITNQAGPSESTGFRHVCVISTPPDTGDASAFQTGDDHHRFRGFKPALAACLLTWPYDLPPTHALSSVEFRAYMPTFKGTRLSSFKGGSEPHHLNFPILGAFCDSPNACRKSVDAPFKFQHPTSDEQDPLAHLFADLPTPSNDVELAFTKFQALNAHGYAEHALIWARYLAYRILYLSDDIIHKSELIAFETVTERQAPDSSKNGLNNSEGMSTDHRPTVRIASLERNTNNSRRSKKMGTCSVGNSSVFTNGLNDTSQSGRSKKPGYATDSTDSSSDRAAQSNTRASRKAVEWATKISHLLDQIRCLMECLTRGYDDTLANPTNLSSASRITSSGRALLMFRGPDPASVDLHLDDTACPVAQQTVHHDSAPIQDDWVCIDIELAFRLGFLGLSLSRPPTMSPTIEVRLFDQEVGLLTRMCRLPLHRACPHVLSSIRHEAMRIARGLSIYQTDILVPYNLATYVFHQLVGTHQTAFVVARLTDPSTLLTMPPVSGTTVTSGSVAETTNNNAPNTTANNSNGNNESSAGRTSSCPVLATGAILDGSGLPLVVSNYLTKQCEMESDERERKKDGSTRRLGGTQSAYLLQVDLAQLEDAVLTDAELGLSAVLSVLGVRSRVPEATYTYFVEGQWAQLNALAVYVIRHYRDELAKLDRILLHLLDRYYNPNFLAPPLWACLTLTPRDLMRYTLPESDSTNQQEVKNSTSNADVDDSVINTVSSQLPTDPTCLLFPADLELSNEIGASLVTGSFNSAPVVANTIGVLESESYPNPIPSTSDTTELVMPTITAPMSLSPTTLEATFVNHQTIADHETVMQSIAATPHPTLDQEQGQTQSEIAPASYRPCSSPSASPAHMQPRTTSDSCIFDPASASEDTDTLSDSKRWAEAFRCATLRNPKRFGSHSVGMAAVDTSAPETTSSDNSPATARRMCTVRSVQSNLADRATEGLPAGEIGLGTRSVNSANSGLSTPGSAFPTRNAMSALRTRSRALGAGVGAILTAHGPVSSYSSTSMSEDDDHVPSRTDPPNLGNQQQQQSPELLPATDGVFTGESNDVTSLSGLLYASHTPRPSHTTLDGDEVDHEDNTRDAENPEARLDDCDNAYDVDNDGDGSFEPVGEMRSVTTTRSNGTAENLTNSDLTDQWADLFERLPPQPLSNSIAFHTFNLAKLVRKLAGGPRTSGSVFMAEPDANGTVHRNLHLVAFQIGLFGMGLYNSLHPSWQSRTFSRDSGWISQQVFEIGIPAACILYHSWQQHLTAAELAGIAFQLSRENNRALVDIAAELCLASLNMCTTLKPLEIYRAISQCEEHSSLTLERGLLRIENSESRTSYGILPEIHFFLARSWFSLHQSVTEEYNKALEIFQQQMQSVRASMQILKQQCNSVPDTEPEGASKPVSSDPQSSGALNMSIASSLPGENPVSMSGPQATTHRTTWPNPSMFRSPLFIPVSLIPPQQQQQQQSVSAMQLSRDPSLMYPNSLNSTGAPYRHVSSQPPPHPASVPVYPSVFYYTQPGLGFNQNPVYNHYRPTQPPPSQPALLPTPGQSNPLVYTQTAGFTQIPCMQTMIASSFSGSSGLLAPNSQMMPPPPPPMNSVPLGPFVTPGSCIPPTQASQTTIPANRMFFQLQRDQLSDPALYATNLTSLVTSQAPVSVAMCTATPFVGRDGLVAVATMLAPNALTPSRVNSFVNSPPPCAPQGATQLVFTQRMSSTSNASSSVVVHPALSDRASSASETDSSRPADSVVEDGLLLLSSEDQPGAASGTQSVTNGIKEFPSDDSAALVASDLTIGSDKTDTTPLSTCTALKALDAKAHQYLRRAYLCATSAIKKIFLNNSPNSTSFDNSAGSHTSSSVRGTRGHKSHHHHHHHHHPYPSTTAAATTTTQSRRPHDMCSSTAASCGGTACDSASLSSDHVMSSNTSGVSSENGRNKRILEVRMESQVAKAWNANILWTLDVASGLGPSVVYEYCNLILQCVQCPLLMNEITVKVIDYFKRIGSNRVTNRNFMPLNGGFADPPSTTTGSDHSNPTCSTSVRHAGQEPSSVQYYRHPSAVTPWTIFSPPPSQNDTWPNSLGRADRFPPFAHPNSYLNQAQPRPIPSPAAWLSSFPPIVSVTGDSLNELIMHYQRLGFHPPEQLPQVPGTMRESCLIVQSPPICATPSTPHSHSQQPQTRQQQLQPNHDAVSCPPHQSRSGVVQWTHPATSQSLVNYPPSATMNQPPTVPVTSSSPSGIDPMNGLVVGQELIERFVNRTHALFHTFIEHRLQYIGQGQTEWDEFVDLILKAYNVHLSTPATDYGLHWNALLTRIRRHHKCSASLWQRILAGIQTADLKRAG